MIKIGISVLLFISAHGGSAQQEVKGVVTGKTRCCYVVKYQECEYVSVARRASGQTVVVSMEDPFYCEELERYVPKKNILSFEIIDYEFKVPHQGFE